MDNGTSMKYKSNKQDSFRDVHEIHSETQLGPLPMIKNNDLSDIDQQMTSLIIILSNVA